MKGIILYFLLLLLFPFAFLGCSEGENESENEYNGKTKAIFNSAVSYGSLTDQDGNEYRTVQLGTQTWMAENLRTKKLKDGTPIPEVRVNDEWFKKTTPAWCAYENTKYPDSIATFGLLYNRHAAKSNLLCPTGWHVSTDEDWKLLEGFLGMTDDQVELFGLRGTNEGTKLKEIGITHWNSEFNISGTNSTGFTALPGGSRTGTSGTFEAMGGIGLFFSGIPSSTEMGFRKLESIREGISREKTYDSNIGFSVRCVKDSI
jgi:uncharacterized protein (TIGR02145 family)